MAIICFYIHTERFSIGSGVASQNFFSHIFIRCLGYRRLVVNIHWKISLSSVLKIIVFQSPDQICPFRLQKYSGCRVPVGLSFLRYPLTNGHAIKKKMAKDVLPQDLGRLNAIAKRNVWNPHTSHASLPVRSSYGQEYSNIFYLNAFQIKSGGNSYLIVPFYFLFSLSIYINKRKRDFVCVFRSPNGENASPKFWTHRFARWYFSDFRRSPLLIIFRFQILRHSIQLDASKVSLFQFYNLICRFSKNYKKTFPYYNFILY